MRAGGRLYWRRVRERERSISAAPLECRNELDYDRDSIMETFDFLDQPWRDLINEHGFTPVIKARRETSDIVKATKMMKQRHAFRQQQLAQGDF